MKRIDLSEAHKFMQIMPPHSTTGSILIYRFSEAFNRAEQLGGLKIKAEDAPKVFIAAMLSSGIDTKEILAELFAQVNNIDADQLEYLMRK